MAINQCHLLLNVSLPVALVWLLDGGGHQPYSFGMALSSYHFCGETPVLLEGVTMAAA